MEALVLWCNNDEIAWHMVDDGERVGKFCNAIAVIIIETFRALWKDKLIYPNSPIKNIGLVAAMIATGIDENCIGEESTHVDRVIEMCKRAGIEVRLAPDEFEEE